MAVTQSRIIRADTKCWIPVLYLHTINPSLSFSHTTLSLYKLYMNSLFTLVSNSLHTLMITKYIFMTFILPLNYKCIYLFWHLHLGVAHICQMWHVQNRLLVLLLWIFPSHILSNFSKWYYYIFNFLNQKYVSQALFLILHIQSINKYSQVSAPTIYF